VIFFIKINELILNLFIGMR